MQDNVMNSMRSVMYGMQRGEEPIQWLAVVTMFKPVPEEELPERVQLQLFGALNIYDPDEILTAGEAIHRAVGVALRLSGAEAGYRVP